MTTEAREGGSSVPVRTYRCTAAARWLPRTLAASVLVAAYLASRAMDPAGVVPGLLDMQT